MTNTPQCSSVFPSRGDGKGSQDALRRILRSLGDASDDAPLIRPPATFSPTSGEKVLTHRLRSLSPLVGESVGEAEGAIFSPTSGEKVLTHRLRSLSPLVGESVGEAEGAIFSPTSGEKDLESPLPARRGEGPRSGGEGRVIRWTPGISTIALATLLFAAGAMAAQPRPASTVVLLPLDNVAGSDQGRATVTELLARAMTARGWQVVSGAAVETLLETDRVRYLDSLEEGTRTRVLTAAGAAAIVSGTLYTWVDGRNPVVALSAKMVRTDGTVAWSNIGGVSADDTEELLGFGRKTKAEEVAAAAVTSVMRRFPQPGEESSPLSGPSKPIFRTGPASFRATDFDPATPHRLCVLPFDNASDVPEAARVVADVLALRLAAASGFEVVDSAVLRGAALKARIGSFRWIASEDLAKLSPLVGTTLFLRGTIYKYADVTVRPGVIPELQLELSLVDIQSGRVLWSAQHDRRGSDYLGFLMLGSVSNGVALTDRVVSEMIGAEARGRRSAASGGRNARAKDKRPENHSELRGNSGDHQ